MFRNKKLGGAIFVKKSEKKSGHTTVDAAEIRQFEQIASEWWDEKGPLKPLHKLNPVRMGYIKEQVCTYFDRDAGSFTPFTGLRMADIGCGGGLVAEPLCRLGADVTGIDAGVENIKAAKQHAAAQGLKIDYRATTVEVAAEKEKFDVVTALEIIEHVSDPALFISSCCKLVKKGGMIIFSTLNRTPKSYLLGIVAAEYVLRWVPAGTHDWKKFVKPSELKRPLMQEGLEVTDISGLVYNPFERRFDISKKDIDVNYFLTAVR
jgi:2-polyprenyl-6-hydroxyphenyl methylase/3-demethylubiquinone-9 3-methyltransferase